jgi:hypothetical protein
VVLVPRRRPKVERRRKIHFALGTLGWLVFAYYWFVVGRRPLNPQTVVALAALGVLIGTSILVLTGWIVHNRRLYRRMQRRRRRPTPPEDRPKDDLGRWVVVDRPERLREARYVVVEVRRKRVGEREEEEKVYRTGEPLPGGET